MRKQPKKNSKKFKVVILAGGQGTRLREETEFRPKPMVQVGERPILWHIMKIFSHFGLKDFVVCLGYKGEMIKDYFLRYEIMHNDLTVELDRQKKVHVHGGTDEQGWKITFAETGLNTMTGARIARVKKYIDTDLFFLTYGDGVADIDIDKLLEFHLSHGKVATVTGVQPPSRFGELIAKQGQVLEFSEKPQTTSGSLINGGFFIFDKRIFKYLDEKEDCVLEKIPLEQLAREKQLMVYRHGGFWQCMDTVRDAALLNSLWESHHAPWKIWGANNGR